MHRYGHLGPRQAAQTRAHSRLLLHSVPGGIFPPPPACTSDAKPNCQHCFHQSVLYFQYKIEKKKRKKEKKERELPERVIKRTMKKIDLRVAFFIFLRFVCSV